MRFREVRIVSTPRRRSTGVAPGVPADRCVQIRPACLSRQAPPARADVRRQLGLADDDFILLTPGESTRPPAHERAVWAASILHVTDERDRVLLWGRGPRLDIAAGLGDGSGNAPGRPGRARAGRRVDFADLLPAADAMLVTPNDLAPTLPVALAIAAAADRFGRASRPGGIARRWGDRPHGARRGPAQLAQRVLDLGPTTRPTRDHDERRARLGELFSPQRKVQTYRAFYGLVASEKRRSAVCTAQSHDVAVFPFSGIDSSP